MRAGKGRGQRSRPYPPPGMRGSLCLHRGGRGVPSFLIFAPLSLSPLQPSGRPGAGGEAVRWVMVWGPDGPVVLVVRCGDILPYVGSAGSAGRHHVERGHSVVLGSAVGRTLGGNTFRMRSGAGMSLPF